MMHVPRKVGSPWQMAGSDVMCWADVLVSIVMVSTVFHLICPVRFCDCRGGAEWVVVMLSRVSYFPLGGVGRKPVG